MTTHDLIEMLMQIRGLQQQLDGAANFPEGVLVNRSSYASIARLVESWEKRLATLLPEAESLPSTKSETS